MVVTVRKIIGVVASILTLGSAAPNERCERTCLEGFISQYLDALIAHNSSSLPTTPGVKYVENDQILPLGSGEWHIVESLGKYNHTFSDPETGQVATITTIIENGVGAIYTVRLKIEPDGNISEIETQITRDAGGFERYEQRVQPEPVWFEAVAPENRISRDELISQTNKYYTGMQGNDPNGDYSFFDKECNRLEDGLQTTNVKTGDPYGHSNDTVFASLSCEEQFQTGFLGFVTKIRERHFPVVDEERQAVFAITTLDHNGTVRTLPSVNGTSSPIPPYFDTPRSLIATEAFRLNGEKLYRIEMTLTEVPYGMKAGYPQDPPVDLSGPGTNFTVYPDPCDRVCLENVVGDILMSLRVHDHTRLPLAKGIRYSENGQFLALGDGLWETLEAISWTDSYAVVLADEERETAGYWGFSQEHSIAGVLALRIAVKGGQITEIEAIAVRAETNDSRGGSMTLMRPPLPVEWEGDESAEFDAAFQERSVDGVEISPDFLDVYFDGLERHSSEGIPFAPGCARRDNLVQTNLTCADQLNGQGVAPNGLPNNTTTVRDRRVLAVDRNRAIALSVALIDEPANGPGPLSETTRIPGTYMVPQLFKVNNGTITYIESAIKWMPFGYTSEWSKLES
ncbi:hypothetical protein F5B19DRAFT_472375 [Rostrohypoxylon terebratum]|nr:hypothetical protein F5B19DRAFT_472375 [Rostrohypoxylon terebratum]